MNPVTSISPSRQTGGRLAQAPAGHVLQHRVVYCDTDAMGVVYHGRYLDIAERSRTEFIALVGIDLGELEKTHNTWLLVNRVRADYRRPVLLHEIASVTSQILKVGASQVWWRSQIHVGAELAANIDVGTASFDVTTRQATVMPEELRRQIEALAMQENLT
jgi:YbgC/YbaW family acyl-CoA thioester hydrolase